MKILKYSFLLITLTLIACGMGSDEGPNSDAITANRPWFAEKAFGVAIEYEKEHEWKHDLFESIYKLSETEATKVIDKKFDSVVSRKETAHMEVSLYYEIEFDDGIMKNGGTVKSNTRFKHFVCNTVEADADMPSEAGYSFKHIDYREGLYWIDVKSSSPYHKNFLSLKMETYDVAIKKIREHFALPHSASFKDIVVDMRYRYDSAGTHLYARLAFMKE